MVVIITGGRLRLALPRCPFCQRKASSKLDEALQAYRANLAIATRLAGIESNNTLWQSDLGATYEKIAQVLWRQKKLDDALVSLRETLAIHQKLADSDRSNAGRRRFLRHQSLNLKPNDPSALDRLGLVFLKLGQYDNSIAK